MIKEEVGIQILDEKKSKKKQKKTGFSKTHPINIELFYLLYIYIYIVYITDVLIVLK